MLTIVFKFSNDFMLRIAIAIPSLLRKGGVQCKMQFSYFVRLNTSKQWPPGVHFEFFCSFSPFDMLMMQFYPLIRLENAIFIHNIFLPLANSTLIIPNIAQYHFYFFDCSFDFDLWLNVFLSVWEPCYILRFHLLFNVSLQFMHWSWHYAYVCV